MLKFAHVRNNLDGYSYSIINKIEKLPINVRANLTDEKVKELYKSGKMSRKELWMYIYDNPNATIKIVFWYIDNLDSWNTCGFDNISEYRGFKQYYEQLYSLAKLAILPNQNFNMMYIIGQHIHQTPKTPRESKFREKLRALGYICFDNNKFIEMHSKYAFQIWLWFAKND